jgi:putative transposase
MGTVGDCYDCPPMESTQRPHGVNAPMESFWGSMQIELLNRQSWKTVVELSGAMAEWIESFYNPVRRHSALKYMTPNEYEALHSKETQAAFS